LDTVPPLLAGILTFLVLQGWLGLLTTLLMLPLRMVLGRWLYLKFGQTNPHIQNMEGRALTFVINARRRRLDSLGPNHAA